MSRATRKFKEAIPLLSEKNPKGFFEEDLCLSGSLFRATNIEKKAT